MSMPAGVKYAIIGAGIHGLSTAYHLALRLKETGRGSGRDILVLDKTAIAAGASGIACGVVRNNYFQPAMRNSWPTRWACGKAIPGLQLPSRRLHADSPEVMHERLRLDLRAAASHRLSLGVRRGREKTR